MGLIHNNIWPFLLIILMGIAMWFGARYYETKLEAAERRAETAELQSELNMQALGEYALYVEKRLKEKGEIRERLEVTDTRHRFSL